MFVFEQQNVCAQFLKLHSNFCQITILLRANLQSFEFDCLTKTTIVHHFVHHFVVDFVFYFIFISFSNEIDFFDVIFYFFWKFVFWIFWHSFVTRDVNAKFVNKSQNKIFTYQKKWIHMIVHQKYENWNFFKTIWSYDHVIEIEEILENNNKLMKIQNYLFDCNTLFVTISLVRISQ